MYYFNVFFTFPYTITHITLYTIIHDNIYYVNTYVYIYVYTYTYTVYIYMYIYTWINLFFDSPHGFNAVFFLCQEFRWQPPQLPSEPASFKEGQAILRHFAIWKWEKNGELRCFSWGNEVLSHGHMEMAGTSSWNQNLVRTCVAIGASSKKWEHPGFFVPCTCLLSCKEGQSNLHCQKR